MNDAEDGAGMSDVSHDGYEQLPIPLHVSGPGNMVGNTAGWVCTRCGALVLNVVMHEVWHGNVLDLGATVDDGPSQ